ncbi:unnamed protein product [Effrenium voratum]|uniref:MYND-type domain-containing protein n=1 Tax=Effrenium voratum TaxID=2562239 RepID=A0AA36IYY8_9DINO|nr:unnamed protein product [Effrenium voratum]
MAGALRRGAEAFEALRRCVEACGEPCEGSIMHTWNSWAPVPAMEAKQRTNLFHLAQSLGGSALILEVGFNAGHSVCLMLLANASAKVVAFDLCEHRYTKPCVEVLRRFFGPRLELVEGSSTNTLPEYRQRKLGFDLFHIDGGHQYHQALADLRNCRALARGEALLVLDDTEIVGVGAAWSDFLAAGALVELAPPHELGRFKHGIGKVVPDSPAKCSACLSLATFACGGCRQVRYCSDACARRHWRRHRAVCSSRWTPPAPLTPLTQIEPALLKSRADGVLVAAEDLAKGAVLFEEPPLAWQPAPARRSSLCTCGHPGVKLCTVCGQASLCGSCTCRMCPELKITQGHVGTFTLVALDVLRRWEEGHLPAESLAAVAAVPTEAVRSAQAVQKVAHFCSAVRWSDRRAEEILAAVIRGRIEHATNASPVARLKVGIGYYPKFARLRAANAHAEANVEVKLAPCPAHACTIQAVLKEAVPAGEPLRVG